MRMEIGIFMLFGVEQYTRQSFHISDVQFLASFWNLDFVSFYILELLITESHPCLPKLLLSQNKEEIHVDRSNLQIIQPLKDCVKR